MKTPAYTAHNYLNTCTYIQKERAKRPQMVIRLNVFRVTAILFFKTCLFELYVQQLYIRFHLIRKKRQFLAFRCVKVFFRICDGTQQVSE